MGKHDEIFSFDLGADHPNVRRAGEAVGKALEGGCKAISGFFSEVFKGEKRRKREKRTRALRHAGGWAACGALAAAACAIGYAVWRKKRDGDRRAELLRESGAGAIISAGDTARPTLRDPLPGEQHDIIVLEDVEDGAPDGSDILEEGEEGDDPPGLARPQGRRPQGAVRRIFKRKKFVSDVDNRGVPTDACIACIVASARLEYAHGDVDPGAAPNARAYLVRAMRAAGINPAEMARRIDRMVVAALVVTHSQKKLADTVDEMKRLNMFNHHRPY
nr:MAG: hypothetical protein [Chemarfal virus 275]